MEFLIIIFVGLFIMSFISKNSIRNLTLAKAAPCRMHTWQYLQDEKRLKCSTCGQYPAGDDGSKS